MDRRKHKMAEHLPRTPEKPAHSPHHSPIILLHGAPLNTPAKVHFGLLPSDALPAPPTMATITNAAGVPQREAPRKNSFQRAVDVNKETLENTKRNAGYVSVDIVKEIVRVDGPRPPSPSSAFLKGQQHRHIMNKPDLIDEGDDDTFGNGKKISFVGVSDALEMKSTEPPFYDTQFPLKPAIRLKPAHKATSKQREAEKERVVVKRIIYADDDPQLIPVPVPAAVQKPVHSDPPKTKLGGARRIPR